MKKVMLLLTIAVLEFGGCAKVDLSGFSSLAFTMQSVQPRPAPSTIEEGATPMLAHHVRLETPPGEIP